MQNFSAYGLIPGFAALAKRRRISWRAGLCADAILGHQYSHPIIRVWDAIVRLGFFVLFGLLLSSMRRSFLNERRLARIDALTELFTRRAFEERLSHDLALAQRRRSTVTVAYIDLDDFKPLNDEHGHAEGDRVLRLVGQALRNSLREVDTAARLGGDEFAIALPDTDDSEARLVVAKFRRALQEALAGGVQVGCSIGVATVQDVWLSPERVIAAADEQMYKAKRAQKGSTAFIVLQPPVKARAAIR